MTIDLLELLGWTSTVMLAACTFPQALHVHRLGNARGMSPSFLLLWISGSTLALVYLILGHPDATPVIAARVLNYLPLAVMLYYMYRPREP